MRIEKVKNCGECRYFNPLNNLCVVLGGKTSKFATGCPANYIKPPTVFQEITASPEVLAEKLVYPTAYVEPHYTHLITRWHSTVTEGEWETKPEAITATRWKLNEVGE